MHSHILRACLYACTPCIANTCRCRSLNLRANRSICTYIPDGNKGSPFKIDLTIVITANSSIISNNSDNDDNVFDNDDANDNHNGNINNENGKVLIIMMILTIITDNNNTT